MAPLLRLRGLAKAFGAVQAVHPVDLDVAAGEVCAILGPSGCGKSTLLRLVAGFARASAGQVEIDGQDMTALGPERRPTNTVFQSYGLFPHLDVHENVAFGLRLARRPEEEVRRRVGEALSLVRLDGFGERGVGRLSGGQQQRVALARALVMRPKVLLLDEPLAALDLKLRQAMQEELRRIHREIGGTFLFVTHDQGEAFHLADRLVVMRDGRVEQEGSPAEVYRRPRSLFVAGFVGEANILKGTRRRGRVELDAGPSFDDAGPDGAVAVIVRPETMLVAATADGHALEATVTDLVFTGPATRVARATRVGERLVLDARAEEIAPARVGATLRVGWPAAAQRVVSAC